MKNKEFHLQSDFKKRKSLLELIQRIEISNSAEEFQSLKGQFSVYLESISEDTVFSELAQQKDFINQSIHKYEFIERIFPFFSEDMQNEKDQHFLKDLIIQKTDGLHNERKVLPLTLILHNLRSSFNVGSIIRTAECFGVKELIFTGYTPLPDHPKVRDTSMQTSDVIKWTHFQSILSVISDFKKAGIKVFALETAEPSIPLCNLTEDLPFAVIVGNEALGIEASILQLCDGIIQIPLAGWKNSLNVGVATALCCYEIFRSYDLKNSI